MLGFDIYVRRLPESAFLFPLKVNELPKDTTLASWTTSIDGLDWITELVKAGIAKSVDSDVYGYTYLVPAAYVFKMILSAEKPQSATASTVFNAVSVEASDWMGKIRIQPSRIYECPIDELLLVEAWDLS